MLTSLLTHVTNLAGQVKRCAEEPETCCLHEQWIFKGCGGLARSMAHICVEELKKSKAKYNMDGNCNKELVDNWSVPLVIDGV